MLLRWRKSYYNSSNVCLWVCSLSPPRSFGGSSPNLVGVCRWTSHLPLRGSFSKRSTGRRVNGSLWLSTILYMRQPHATQRKRRLLLGSCLQQSLIRRLLLHILHLKCNVCRCTSQLPLRGSFSKRSMGRQGSTGQQVKLVDGSHLDCVCRWTSQLSLRGSFSKSSTGRRVNGSNGSTGQQVTFTFTILYMIADDARLTPPPLQKANGVWWHQAHATPLQKAHSVFCSFDG